MDSLIFTNVSMRLGEQTEMLEKLRSAESRTRSLAIQYSQPLPDQDDEEFTRYVSGHPNSAIAKYELREDECIGFPDEADPIASDTYASYGDGDTTASANVWGMPMQITRYLGSGCSGFFCVDVRKTPEPYLVQERASYLMDLNRNKAVGIICWEDISREYEDLLNDSWKLDFVHDRWPRYTCATNNVLAIDCQHYVSKGTVFIRTILSTDATHIQMKSLFRTLQIIPDQVQIRELDFVQPENSFDNNDQPRHFLGPHGRSVIIRNRSYGCESSAVALVSAVSINGEIREFEEVKNGDGIWYKVKNQSSNEFFIGPSKQLEVVEAYRLRLLPKEPDWKKCLISGAEFLSFDSSFKAEVFGRLQFSQNPRLDFIFRRNLEHILSVCSIQVPLKPAQTTMKTESNGLPIALTCGDVSGHRLVTSVSYFAFQFLLSVYKYLINTPCGYEAHQFRLCRCGRDERSVCDAEMHRILCERIKKTCKAHLTWVEHAKRPEGCFRTHYWASGEEIFDYRPRKDDLSTQTLTDTPFQILKLADSADVFDDQHKRNVQELLRGCVRPWVRNLDQQNKRGFFAFARTISVPRVGYHNYRLEDHAWIWSALKVIDQLGLGKELSKDMKERRKQTPRTDEIEKPPDNLLWEYSPADFRRNVLRRFTAQDPVSKQRMLAVARSPSENRFLFRNRDTALFHDTKTVFFGQLDELWQATIEAQKFHVENQDATWDSPLRYALSLLMAVRGLQINNRSTKEMLKTAKQVLLQTSSASGMIPGQLNVETKEPEIFEDDSRRDSYWHASFETLYILWQVRNNMENDRVSPHPATSDNPSWDETQIPMTRQGNDLHMSQRYVEMRKSMPHNSLIDQQSIVEISDEWLYKLPDFLDYDPPTERKIKKIVGNNKKCIEEVYNQLYESLGQTSSLQDVKSPFNSDSLAEDDTRGVIIDVPNNVGNAGYGRRCSDLVLINRGHSLTSDDRFHQEAPDDGINILNSRDMYKVLSKMRTAENAGKRLVWSPNASVNVAKLYILASPPEEVAPMAAFFDRHQHREKYFFDETIAALNSWKTEFHLSSYQCHNKQGRDTDFRFLGSKMWIRRAGTGFRITGDFFNNYWTCHVLEYEPKDGLEGDPFNSDKPDEEWKERFRSLVKNRLPKNRSERDKKPWRERKVLELILFDRMLEKIIGRYKEMLDETDKHLKDLPTSDKSKLSGRAWDTLSLSNDLFSMEMDSYAYLAFSKKLPPFLYTLQVMEEDLKTTLDTIELWRTRELDRLPERPRWTRYKESKYRSVITRIAASNNHQIRDLERYHARIQSLRASLTTRLASTRDDLSFESAENVKLFTYLTAVFLPLGLGVATMSTNKLPSGDMVLNMFVAAMIFIVPTIVLLVYSRKLYEKLRPLLKRKRDRGDGEQTKRQPEPEKQELSDLYSTCSSSDHKSSGLLVTDTADSLQRQNSARGNKPGGRRNSIIKKLRSLQEQVLRCGGIRKAGARGDVEEAQGSGHD